MRSYVGIRPASGPVQVFVMEGREMKPLPPQHDLWNHSPDGFEWGYNGSGPAQLALALLANACGCGNIAIDLHQRYKAEFVAGFAKSDWATSREEILAWVVKTLSHMYFPPTEFRLGEESCNGA